MCKQCKEVKRGDNNFTMLHRYPAGLTRDIWDKLCFYYDKVHPTQPKKVSELPQEFNDVLDSYIETDTFLICELPIVHGKEGHIDTPTYFNAYNSNGVKMENHWIVKNFKRNYFIKFAIHQWNALKMHITYYMMKLQSC